MSSPTHVFKIDGFIKWTEYNKLPFGRQIEYIRNFDGFKEKAKRGWLNTKRKTVEAALREFMTLNNVKQFYFKHRQSATWHDDSIEIWYKTA
jgi:hypothetical protein